jgi:hypothetical protein
MSSCLVDDSKLPVTRSLVKLFNLYQIEMRAPVGEIKNQQTNLSYSIFSYQLAIVRKLNSITRDAQEPYL